MVQQAQEAGTITAGFAQELPGARPNPTDSQLLSLWAPKTTTTASQLGFRRMTAGRPLKGTARRRAFVALEGGGVNHEAVAHVRGEDALVGFVDLVGRD